MAAQGGALLGISWGEGKAACKGLSEGTRLFLQELWVGGHQSKLWVLRAGKPSKEGEDCQLR